MRRVCSPRATDRRRRQVARPRGRRIALSISVARPAKQDDESQPRPIRPANRVEVVVEAGPVRESITQEFGTAINPAHPYMRPAWHGQRDNALKIVKEQLGVEIDKAAARAARKAARIAAKVGAS
jgi:hypothetical protein